MSPAFEAFLARLYVDADARAQFLANPRDAAAQAQLSPDEVEAVTRIDRSGLELAAASFAAKRRHAGTPRRRSSPRMLARVLAYFR
jgi:hypothetical protein